MIDPFQILEKEYSLSEDDIKIIKLRFIGNKIFDNDLFIGQFFDEKPTMVIGAPCIRNDIEGISLATFYQIFMPLKIASILQIPCKIFLGIREEVIFQPKLFEGYQKLGLELTNGIRQIASDLNNIDVEIVNTSSYGYDTIINACVKKLNIELSAEDSTYLFNLSLKKAKKQLHSKLRVFSSKRVVAYNTSYTLTKLFGEHKFLIVEDIGQHICVLFARKFDKYNSPNFLAFLSLPNIYGTATIFKSGGEERFILSQNKNYYWSIIQKSPQWVLEIYNKVFNLVSEEENTFFKDFASTYETIKKVSNYFTQIK